MSVDFEQKVFPCTFVPYKIPFAISLWTVIPTIEVSSQIRVTDNASGSVLNRSSTNLLYSQSVSSDTSAFGNGWCSVRLVNSPARSAISFLSVCCRLLNASASSILTRYLCVG